MRKKVLIDAGHGLIKNSSGDWTYQREEIHGYREDLGTQLMASFLGGELTRRGLDVSFTRPLINSEYGQKITASGEVAWKQGALEFVRMNSDGHPEYWESEGLDKSKDIRCRPIYANLIKPDFAISLHSNAAHRLGAHGVSLWYWKQNNSTKEFRNFCNLTIANLVKANPLFDGLRGVRGDSPKREKQAGKWAWFRLMDKDIPAALLEFLFHTNETDRNFLKDVEQVKLGMFAVADAICEYLEIDWVASLPETAKEALIKIAEGKPMPSEVSDLVDKHFWDLI